MKRRVNVPQMSTENFTQLPSTAGNGYLSEQSTPANSPSHYMGNNSNVSANRHPSAFNTDVSVVVQGGSGGGGYSNAASYNNSAVASPAHFMGGPNNMSGASFSRNSNTINNNNKNFGSSRSPRKGGSGNPRGGATTPTAFSDTNLFLRHLPPTIDDVTLRAVFERFGDIVSASVMRNIHTGESLGTAFVRFETPAEAKAAFTFFKSTGRFINDKGEVEEKNPDAAAASKAKKDGKSPSDGTTEEASPPVSAPASPQGKLTIQWARRQHDEALVGEKRNKARKLFIRNIPLDVTEEQLLDMFAEFGPIEQVTLHTDTAAQHPAPLTPQSTKKKAAATSAKEGNKDVGADEVEAEATEKKSDEAMSEEDGQSNSRKAADDANDNASAPAENDSPSHPPTATDNEDGQVPGTKKSDDTATADEGEKRSPSAETEERLIAFITFLEDGCAANACDKVHNSLPFPSCHNVPLMAKLAEDNKQRNARRNPYAGSNGHNSNNNMGTPNLGPARSPNHPRSSSRNMSNSGDNSPYHHMPGMIQIPRAMDGTAAANHLNPSSGMVVGDEGREGGEVPTLFNNGNLSTGLGKSPMGSSGKSAYRHAHALHLDPASLSASPASSPQATTYGQQDASYYRNGNNSQRRQGGNRRFKNDSHNNHMSHSGSIQTNSDAAESPLFYEGGSCNSNSVSGNFGFGVSGPSTPHNHYPGCGCPGSCTDGNCCYAASPHATHNANTAVEGVAPPPANLKGSTAINVTIVPRRTSAGAGNTPGHRPHQPHLTVSIPTAMNNVSSSSMSSSAFSANGLPTVSVAGSVVYTSPPVNLVSPMKSPLGEPAMGSGRGNSSGANYHARFNKFSNAAGAATFSSSLPVTSAVQGNHGSSNSAEGCDLLHAQSSSTGNFLGINPQCSTPNASSTGGDHTPLMQSSSGHRTTFRHNPYSSVLVSTPILPPADAIAAASGSDHSAHG